MVFMDLTYPNEAEEFRAEIKGWLLDNLPDGWFDEGFEMTTSEREALTPSGPRSSSKVVGSAPLGPPSTAARD